MASIEFTDNYEDLSTESGYQFKFNCERCGNGYMSTWKASKSGMATGLLRGAGSMFGGFLGSASSGADQLEDLIQGPRVPRRPPGPLHRPRDPREPRKLAERHGGSRRQVRIGHAGIRRPD